MGPDPSDVRERAWVEHREPSMTSVDEAMWVAEDPETQCVGVGDFEAEAVGNLVSVVCQRDPDGTEDRPEMKLPGRVVPRPSMQDGVTDSMFGTLRSLFSTD